MTLEMAFTESLLVQKGHFLSSPEKRVILHTRLAVLWIITLGYLPNKNTKWPISILFCTDILTDQIN